MIAYPEVKKKIALLRLNTYYKSFAQGSPGKTLLPALFLPLASFCFFSELVETFFFIYIETRRWHNGS